MSQPAPPTIPPRPVKQQAAAQGVSKLPDIPPRPLNKRIDRSVSPANYPSSPLNEPYMPTRPKAAESLARPPSVQHLPTPGEEGMEYANIQYQPQASSALAQDAAAQTRTIAEDLQLHAPKPSLPKSSATAQVQGVTRTDSASDNRQTSNGETPLTLTRSRQSFSRPERPDSAASAERRKSTVYNEEQGPAEIGLRVPINPLLGDVQAPTPSSSSPLVADESPRRHSRKKSGVEDFRPPDSYGLHGHGVIANTKFERDWYAKHPEQLEHEEGQGHGVYEGIGSGRGSFALSSDQLNKIVRDTASRGSGFGTSPDIVSYPDEQIGYMASAAYQRSQQNTPQPEPLSRIQTHASQPAIESPLRRTSFPAEDAPSPEIRKSRQSTTGSDKAVQDDVTHIDLPQRRFNKLTGGQESMNENEPAKEYVSRRDADGNEYRVPILAEDEVAKDIGTEHLHAAVSPKYERHERHERRSSHGNEDNDRSGAITPNSRPASRPGSIYQLHSASHSLSRFMSHQELDREHVHTPLEDVAEYEPLFNDEDEKKAKALSTAERFKRRPDFLQKRFPSQDIWEDTPSSAMYQAEVSVPDLPSQVEPTTAEKAVPNPTFETPEAEHARKEEVTEEEKRKLMPKEERLLKSKHLPHLRDDMPTKERPSLANRFPSQDIWEDSPDSTMLVTTVGGPQMEEEASPTESKPPVVPARPGKSRLGEGASSAQIEPSVPPSIPARPPKRMHQVPPADAKLTDPTTLSKEPSPSELKKTPSIPDRPKPQIPPRPKKLSEDDTLAESASVKAKPQVPARPAAGGIASLKGNFMSDLNKKLGLGPPKEKEKEKERGSEPEVEAKPLEDARKGRARGPQRRAPAKSPAATPSASAAQFSMFAPKLQFAIDGQDELRVASELQAPSESLVTTDLQKPQEAVANTDAPATIASPTKAEQDSFDRPDDAPRPLASGLATNTAGEPADPVSAGDDNTEGELTRKTTASSVSGQSLGREEANAEAHMIPASEQTTATDSDELHDQIEKVPTKQPETVAEDEPIKVRSEQVNASAPMPTNTHSSIGNSVELT